MRPSAGPWAAINLGRAEGPSRPRSSETSVTAHLSGTVERLEAEAVCELRTSSTSQRCKVGPSPPRALCSSVMTGGWARTDAREQLVGRRRRDQDRDALDRRTLTVQHAITINHRHTTIALEEPFWQAIQAAARASGVKVSTLVERIDQTRGNSTLSSALRVFALSYVKDPKARP